MAHATSGPAPTGPLGPDYTAAYLAPFGILMAIVTVTTITRIYCRIRPEWHLAWDDYMLIFAFALTAAWFSLMVFLDVKDGRVISKYPRKLSFHAPFQAAMGLLFFWALNIMRISMCLMLLRLKHERAWKWLLNGLIVLQVCLIIVATSVQMSHCRPLSGLWTPTPGTQCIPNTGFRVYWIIHYAFHVAIDFIISFMPLTFIYGMHRTLLEKMLLCGLMGAGLAATAAALAFLLTTAYCFADCTDAVYNFRLDICTTSQLFLGVIAANLPCLKAPAHRLLIRWGIVRPANRPAAGVSPESFLSKMTHGSHFAQQLHDLAALRDTNDREESPAVDPASLS